MRHPFSLSSSANCRFSILLRIPYADTTLPQDCLPIRSVKLLCSESALLSTDVSAFSSLPLCPDDPARPQLTVLASPRPHTRNLFLSSIAESRLRQFVDRWFCRQRSL